LETEAAPPNERMNEELLEAGLTKKAKR